MSTKNLQNKIAAPEVHSANHESELRLLIRQYVTDLHLRHSATTNEQLLQKRINENVDALLS